MKMEKDLKKLELAYSFDMMVCNMFFKKDIFKLLTLKSGGNSSMIDYVVIYCQENRD